MKQDGLSNCIHGATKGWAWIDCPVNWRTFSLWEKSDGSGAADLFAIALRLRGEYR
jgi:hypothetical protein